MWNWVRRAGQIADGFLDAVVTGAMGLLVLDVLWGVVSRFLLASPSRWTEEVATILLIWVALLGAAVAFRERQHLGVDVLTKDLLPDASRYNALAVQSVVISFSIVVLIWGGYQLVANTLATGQVTAALGVKMGYVYLAVPLSGFFIVWYSAAQAAEIFFGDTGEAGDDVEVKPER